MQYVFIMGFSRTGSTLLEQVLNACTEIGMLPEMKIYWPRWLHKDFATILKNRIGGLDNEGKIDQLIELMYSKKIKGTFWENIEKININIPLLKRNIIKSDRSIKGIINALFVTLSKTHEDRKIAGIKFPVHFMYVDKLIKWFPDCKIIHTIRDPRAIFFSQLNKRYKNKFSYLTQFIHVNASYFGVRRMHEKLKNSNNYYLCHYEKLVLQPEEILKQLCKFLEIEYNSEMIAPRIWVNTSLNKPSMSKGFKTSSVYEWKKRLPKNIAVLIRIINSGSMKRFGYC